jgi:hypothetical protein
MENFVCETAIIIHVYDLPDDAVTKVNEYGYPLGLGAYHSGLEVFNEGVNQMKS